MTDLSNAVENMQRLALESKSIELPGVTTRELDASYSKVTWQGTEDAMYGDCGGKVDPCPFTSCAHCHALTGTTRPAQGSWCGEFFQGNQSEAAHRAFTAGVEPISPTQWEFLNPWNQPVIQSALFVRGMNDPVVYTMRPIPNWFVRFTTRLFTGLEWRKC